MADVIGFIDGFNLYHALVEPNKKGHQRYAKYKWLDYWKLTECFLNEDDELRAVYYFTAYISWKGKSGKQKRSRHQAFVAAQRSLGVNVVRGRFRPVWRQCRGSCKETFKTYEEKRTDVNIAVTMVRLALEDKYNKGIVISADSDLIPAVEAIKDARPSTTLMAVAPVGRPAQALFNATHYKKHMKESHLRRSLLPQTIALPSGAVIECPSKWRLTDAEEAI